GDGKLDLAVANNADSSVSVLLGNGDGTFQPNIVLSGGSGTFAVTGADVNNDGKLDLVATYENSNVVKTFLNASNLTAVTVALTASVDPVGAGQPVVFTAKVTSAAGSPSGSVTFQDNGNSLG